MNVMVLTSVGGLTRLALDLDLSPGRKRKRERCKGRGGECLPGCVLLQLR